MSDDPTFTVTLHHLAPGAKQVGVAWPDLELTEISAKKLRELIRALAALASSNFSPAMPELRVVAPHGQFVVQVAEGRLRINSWTIRVGGSALSPDQIFALITGTEAVAEAVGMEIGGTRSKRSRGAIIALLAALIIGSNGLTAWMLTRPPPPPPLLPDFVPLAAEPAARFLAGLIGEFQTGSNDGDRILRVTKDGRVHWLRLGAKGAITEDVEVAVKPVQSRGQSALLADERTLIEAPDGGSLVFYGLTYRRKAP